MLLQLFSGLNATAIVLILGLIAVIAREVLENLGWWNKSKTLKQEKEQLRAENRDLSMYNNDLRARIDRLVEHDREKDRQIAKLETMVAELQKRDQEAVLKALEQHEVNADRRTARTHELLESIREVIRGGSVL